MLTRAAAVLSIASLLAAAGCTRPIHARAERELARSVAGALQAELAQAEKRATERVLTRTPADEAQRRLEIQPRFLEQIEAEYGLPAYLRALGGADGSVPPVAALLGEDFYGQAQETAGLSLQRAVAAAVEHNLDVRVAQFAPAIGQAQLVAAEAAFDWQFGAGLVWEDSDTPRTGSSAFGPGGAVIDASQSVTGTASISRRTTTGGTVGVDSSVSYTDVRSSFFGSPSPDPATAAQIGLGITQPLLRNAGEDVNLAEVRLARNAERGSVADLRRSLIGTVTQTEDAYWDLVQRMSELVIRNRLLERGEKVRDDIKARRVQDARQAQVADAIARVERRRGDVLRAQTALRQASDRVKLLINDPALPLGSELLVLPTDGPLDEPMAFSYADALLTAVQHRPEIERAVLAIDDASIRQRAADNLRLPRLDLEARLAMLGLDDNVGDAYDDAFEREFVDNFLIGATFEQPIGNRAGEAEYRASRLRRMRSTVEYRRTVRSVVLDVRTALDNLVVSSKLIEQARLSRLAQAEALRALQVEKELTDRGYSVERLNIELNQQEALAAAEIAEIAAVIDYNRAVARLHEATGTALERNRIDFVAPDANQLLPGDRALDYRIDADTNEAATPAPVPAPSTTPSDAAAAPEPRDAGPVVESLP
jgi:outer membrane protein TolC